MTKLMTLILLILCFLIKFMIISSTATSATTTMIINENSDHILNGHGDDERGGLDERCKREILCTEKDLNGPKICGTNGKTYSNPCELNRIVCFGLPVEMHRMGDCQITERCPLEREFQLKLIRSNSIKYANEFVPICDKSTKLYAQIQCHSVIGYCWCSTSHGNPIPSTSVAISTHKMPECHHLNAIHVGADGKIEKIEHSITTNVSTECSNVERIIFNSNILDVYRREYENVPDEHSPHRGDETGETMERKILVWRFSKLDIDENGQLSMDELSPERRLTVLLVKPTSCARNFHKFCDKNSNRLIDLQEWTTCLKIDFGTIAWDTFKSLRRYSSSSSRKIRHNSSFTTSTSTTKTTASSSLSSSSPIPTKPTIIIKSLPAFLLPECIFANLQFIDLYEAPLPEELSSFADSNRRNSGNNNAISYQTNVLPEPNDDNSLPIYELPTKSPTVSPSHLDDTSHEDSAAALFLETISKKSDPTSSSSSVATSATSADTIEKPNCRAEREKVISSIDPQYLDTIFIPKCTGESDKFYIEIQCHQKPSRKYCWCVHPITGEPTGSSLVEGIDECKKSSKKKFSTKHGSIKGCLPEKELLFYRKLFGLLTKEMREKSPSLPNGPKRRRPQIAKWKFAMLDSNGNNEVERSEWKEFRATLRDLKNVRKCGRNFIRFCDVNKDGRINRREWMRCTVHAYRHAKSTKPNPFLTMLKSVD